MILRSTVHSQFAHVNTLRCLAAVAAIYVCSAAAAVALTIAPPDTRSWEEVTANFAARGGRHANDGVDDGRRLKELNPKKALEFLMPFLAKEREAGLRLKAMGALGWSSFQEAVPALSAIAKDETEAESIRAQALNPGLRYMKSAEAEATARYLANHQSSHIRSSAYWVLSDHATDSAVDALGARIRANDKPLLDQLVYALYYSKHPRAGKIIFDLVDFSTLEHNKRLQEAYATAMDRYRVPEAQEHMLALAKHPPQSLTAYYALRYFASFPREEVVHALIDRAEVQPGDLYESFTEFIESPSISAESKRKLSTLIASGKVRKLEPFPWGP